MDGELWMIQHVGKFSRYASFISVDCVNSRLALDLSSMQRLISAFIVARLDYCNAVITGLPVCTLTPLQSVLSAMARLMDGSTAGNRI